MADDLIHCPTCNFQLRLPPDLYGREVECPQCHSQRLERQWSVPAQPRHESHSLPMGCDPSLPPCGPACRRWPGGG